MYIYICVKRRGHKPKPLIYWTPTGEHERGIKNIVVTKN
jgi:hypothetical protein